MFRPDVLVRQSLGFLGRVGQDALAFVAQREVDRRGDLLPNGRVSFNLLANRFNRSMRAQEAVGQGFVFAQQSQQQMLGLYVRRAELAGFIAREKYYAPGFLRITFEHIAPSPLSWHGSQNWQTQLPRKLVALTTLCNQEA